MKEEVLDFLMLYKSAIESYQMDGGDVDFLYHLDSVEEAKEELWDYIPDLW